LRVKGRRGVGGRSVAPRNRSAEAICPELLRTAIVVPSAVGHDDHRRSIHRLNSGDVVQVEDFRLFPVGLISSAVVSILSKNGPSPGKQTIEFDFKYDGIGFATFAFNDVSGLGHSGTGTLTIEGKVVSTQKMEHTVPLLLPIDETFDIGWKTGTPVDDRDLFTGKIDKLTISVAPPKLTAEDEKKLSEASRAAQDAK
jgi:hypothetical protein